MTGHEVGVELDQPAELHGRLIRSALPAGPVAMTVHSGPHSGLGEAHDAVHRWSHPAWRSNLEVLERSDMTFVDIHTGRPGARPVPSGTGTEVTARFDPTWVRSAVEAALGAS